MFIDPSGRLWLMWPTILANTWESALMKYRGMSVSDAANEVIHKKLPAEGEGGVIALDRKGNFAMSFNSEGMYRGWIAADGVPHVLIYKDPH